MALLSLRFRPATRYLLAVLLLGPLVRSAAADEAPPTPAAAPQSWYFPADLESEHSALVRQGDTVEQVMAQLGKPHSRVKKKKDPSHETLNYVRKVRGPVAQKQVISRNGYFNVRYSITYIYDISLRFQNGIVATAEISRQRSDDSYEGRPFRHD